MLRFILGFIILTFQNTYATETFVQFLINDPQVNGYQYRGLQVGICNVNEAGDPVWYAKIRFADIDDNMCSGKTIITRTANIVGIGVVTSAIACSMVKQEKSLTWKMGSLVMAGGSGLLARKAWSKLHEGLGYWDSKVVIRYNVFSDSYDSGLDLESDDYFDVKKEVRIESINHYDDNLLFEWKLPEILGLKELFVKINSMRVEKRFPHYTLSGLGGCWDAMNCVSFCVRFGHLLGLPFSDNAELLPYIDHKYIPRFSSFRHHIAAKPEKIAQAILADERLKGDENFWVKKDHPWWILSELEEIATGHPKAKDKKNA